MNEATREAGSGQAFTGIAGRSGQDQGAKGVSSLRYEVNATRIGGDGEYNPVAQFSSVQLAASLLPVIALQSGAIFAELIDTELDETVARTWIDETGCSFTIPGDAKYAVREQAEGRTTWDIVATHADEQPAARWYEGEVTSFGRERGATVQLVDLSDLKVLRSTDPEDVGSELTAMPKPAMAN